MFQRLKKLWGYPTNPKTPEPSQARKLSHENLTFESLWNDYECRTWHYDNVEVTLDPPNPRLLNWIGSISHSGHTRKKCLRALISDYEPGDENRILLRLVDWVPQVQVLAATWVLANFRSLSFETLHKNQWLILYLSRKDGLRNQPVMREIESVLLARSKEITFSQFINLSAKFRRFLFTLSLANDQHLRPLILEDPEAFNRLLLLTEFEFSKVTAQELQRLRADKSVCVRRQLFRAQIDAGVAPVRDELMTLVVDSNRSMRKLGQYYLKQTFGEDAYQIYRGLSGKNFFYISDFARREDAEHFLEGVRTGSKMTQYNCLRALASAAPERLQELGISSLITQSNKFCATLLPLLPSLLTIEEILALRPSFEASPHRRIDHFFQILERKSFWTFLDEALSFLLTAPNHPLRQMITLTLNSKISIYELLTPNRRESIKNHISQLREHDPKLNEQMLNLIDFSIRTT